ncbi:MAG: sodium/proline symporter PutP [bacterium]|nr:sodium/proline symporter PutP [bacterium]
MIELPSLITFIIYFLFLTAIGIYFFKKTGSLEDYLLGGRNMGKWVTAISAQASDMSAWLLMALPGAVYSKGMPQAWIAIGLFLGTACNWGFVSRRLRVYTGKTNALTLSTFFENRFKDPTGFLRIFSAIIILIFFTLYASSGLKGAGMLFESMFGMDYRLAVSLGTLVIVVYTFLGGFQAVSWTDLVQGALMVVAIVVVPVMALSMVGGIDAVRTEMAAKNIAGSLFSGKDITAISVISTLAWGLGYFGQPHILARFMGIRSAKELPRAMMIALTWVLISLAGAVIVGLVAIPMFANQGGMEAEKVFIYMISKLFNPWIGGILLAAILSAIMSTIDSQLLVSSSALTEDFYRKIIRKEASEKEVVFVGRLCVIIISIIAMFLAYDPKSSILDLVSYAWGGFGAAFGPLVLFALFSRRTTWQSALAGMLTGTTVLVIWKLTGLGATLYEIVPGFIANTLVILIVNLFVKQKNPEIEQEYNEVRNSL